MTWFHNYEKKDYYAILGLPGNASTTAVKRNYRQLALQWHPDKHPDEEKQRAAENFRQIAEACEVLLDENSKAEYDEIWRRVHDNNSDSAKFCQVRGVYSQAEYETRQAEKRARKVWQDALAKKASEEAKRKHEFAKMCSEHGVDSIAAQDFLQNRSWAPHLASGGIGNQLPHSRRSYRSRI